MAYNVKTNSLTKEWWKTKRILLFNNSCKQWDMVVAVNNVFKLMNDVILWDVYSGVVGRVEEDSESASTNPVLVTLFDDTMTVSVAVEDTETGEVVEATVQWNVLQEIVEETIEDIEEDKSYAYRFLNYDWTVLQQWRAMKGTAPTYTGSTPTRESSVSTVYTFSWRQPAIAEFDTDTDLVAQYSETARMYWVTFENYDWTTLQSTQVAYGETPSYVWETPTNPAWVFDGWTPEIAPVTGDATYMAVFIVHSYQSAPEVDEMTLMNAITADNPDIAPMMIQGVKKVTSRLNVTISTEYIAWWEARNWSTDEQWIVFIQTNASSELVDYVFKTMAELWDDYNTYLEAFTNPVNMTDEIWNDIQLFFINTIHVVSSQGITTIDLNWHDSITVNESTHAMRYDADYYVETNNTSTEYSTLDIKWWLVEWEYIVTDADISMYESIVESIKTKWIANASIQHDISNWEITISNWWYSITIQDKNIGATEYLWKTAWNDALAYWDFYCWWGKAPFTTLPTNEKEEDWSVMQTPVSSWYHIPTLAEVQALIKFMKVIRPTHYKEQFVTALLMPRAGRRNPISGSIEYQWTNCFDWTSNTPGDSDMTPYFCATADEVYTHSDIATGWFTLRCFKDSFTFNDIDSNLWSFASVDDAVNRLKGTVNSAWIVKKYCLDNGSDPHSEWIYRYTSWTTGLNYEWDTTNSTIGISDQGQQAFGTTIMWNNSDWRYHKWATPTFDEVDEALYNCPQIETALDVLNQVILSAPQIIADYVMSHSAQFWNEYSLTSTRGLSYTVVASGGVYTDIIVSHSTNWGANKATWNSSTGVWVNPNASANMNPGFNEEDI